MSLPLPAVTEVLAGAAACRLAVFAGDDRGDLAALDALRAWAAAAPDRRAVGVAVDSTEVPPELLDAVDLTVTGPHGLVACLEEWRAAIAGASARD